VKAEDTKVVEEKKNNTRKKPKSSKNANESCLSDSRDDRSTLEIHEHNDKKEKHEHTASAGIKEDEEKMDGNAADRTIFVGNLPLSMTRKKLTSMFSRVGKVESARIRSVAVKGVKLPPQSAGNQVRVYLFVL
jgi:nucleolar protein 12